MSLRRQDASDEEDDPKSEEEFFSDSEGSIAGREGVDESPGADPELVAATERLRLSHQAEHAGIAEDLEHFNTAPAGSAEPDDESEEVDPSEESDGSFLEQQDAQNEGDGNDVDSLSEEELLGGSEVDITAADEVLEEEQDPNKPVDKSEKAPYEVPVGAFWLHDDRLDEDAGQRRTSRPRKLWDKLDDVPWVHDKFDLPPEEDDYQGFLASSRGRGRGGRGGGASYGSDGSSYPATAYRDDYGNGGGYEGSGGRYEGRGGGYGGRNGCEGYDEQGYGEGRGRGGRRGRGRRGGSQSGNPDDGSSGYQGRYAGNETSGHDDYGFGGRGGGRGRGRRGGVQSSEDNGSYWGGERDNYSRPRGNGAYNGGQNGGQESGYGEYENPPPGYDATPPGYANRPGAGRKATTVDKWPTENAVTGVGDWGTATAEADPADSQWPSLPSQPAPVQQPSGRGAPEPQQGSCGAAELQQGSWAVAKPVVTKPTPAAKPGDWGAIAEQTLGVKPAADSKPDWGSVGAPQERGQPEEQPARGGNNNAGNTHRGQEPSSQQGTNSQAWGAPERWGGAPERSGANGTAKFQTGDWAAAVGDQPRANRWGAPSQPAQQPSAAESGGWGEASNQPSATKSDGWGEPASLPSAAAASQQSWSEGGQASKPQTKPQQQVAVRPGDWGAVAVKTGLWQPSEGGQQEPDVTERWGADTKAADSGSASRAEYGASAPRAEHHNHNEQEVSYGGAAAARPNEWQQPQQPAWTGDAYGQPAEAEWQAPNSDAARRKAFLEKACSHPTVPDLSMEVAAAATAVRTAGGRSQPQQADGYTGHEAQSWQGHRQERSGSLNASAQDFVPPGGGRITQHLLPTPRPSNPEAYHPGQPVTNPAAFAEYGLRPPLPSMPQELRYGFDSAQAYLPYQGGQDVPIEGYAAGAGQMDGGFVPGPMQQSQLYQGAMQAQRPAKRPITIEAPPERERENARAGDQGGGRRYSAMQSQQHYQ